MNAIRWLWLALLCASPTHGAGGQSLARGSLRGVVYDSVRARPLALATVQLVNERDRGTTRATATDRLGRFSADSLEPGRWMVGVQHPWLDSVAVDQLGVLVEIKPNSTSRVSLAVPSGQALVSRVCGDAVADDSSGYVHGVVRRTPGVDDNTPGTVRIQWVEFAVRNAQIERSIDGVVVQSSSNGRYVACGVPMGGTLRVRAWVGADSTGVLDFAVPAHGIGQLDLLIGQASRTTMAIRASPMSGNAAPDTLDATSIEVVRGTARIEGVTRAQTGGAGSQPLTNARVTVWGTGLETRSASDGRFTLNGLPTGSYLLETTAIGYQPSREIVELRGDATLLANARLDRLLMLDTVQVRAQRLRLLGPAMAGFEQRRRSSLGKFLGPEELNKRFDAQTSDLFAMMAGVYLVPGVGGDRVLLRGDFRARCVPTVFIDGVRIPNPDGQDSINDYVSPMEIRAIEVYVSAVTRPFEFSVTNSTCGSIVIWTGPRR